ncbi:MAG TPA: FumA C-terminus/TtdB family hydratase beta subunit [Candidatus Omnitrophota bacterium]|nr:FumA C-terminus/TtdB family hydratase beta subunit [Candidatus Omnitrophota bacterium]HPS20509.1 FumA C-terminus/TtdB family hydratase beta subunit [Candidatus Omnitrophota bacterium]
MKNMISPLKEKDIKALRAGDEVSLSGVILTARDQAHLRLCELVRKGKPFPVDIKGQVIYYCGPTPAGGSVIGACGPTTSSRMDEFTPELLELGLKGMIGKGKRSREVRESIRDEKAVYFVAPAGAGAYLSKRVRTCEVVAFEDLGPEAIYRLEVENFPLIVAIDSLGNDIYENI